MAKKKSWYEKGPVGAVYKAGKDTIAEAQRAPVIKEIVKPVVQTINKAGGDFSAEAKRFGGTISSGGKRIGGQISGAWKSAIGSDDKPKASDVQPMPDYSKNTLALTSYGNNLTTNFGSQIGANEDPNAISQNVRNQYAALGSLAKMREGANAQSEQNAIQRRLASTGMGSSGAGLRLQNLASQQSARRGAETQLGIAAEQAGRESGMQESAIARNMQREQMRLGAAESAAGREFAVQQAEKQDIKDTAQFELDKSITQENQKIARAVQRYNEQGMFGQLFTDLLGRPLSLGKR